MPQAYTPKEPLRVDGFASYEDKTVKDVLTVYRAYGGPSGQVGSCFFTPQIAGIPRSNWTVELLEQELNVVLWGNELRRLATFQLHDGTPYRIGPIAHDGYGGLEKIDGLTPGFDQYSHFKHANLFYQVIVLSKARIDQCWRLYMTLVDDVPIKSAHVVVRDTSRIRRFGFDH